jgi:hypothetical protein
VAGWPPRQRSAACPPHASPRPLSPSPALREDMHGVCDEDDGEVDEDGAPLESNRQLPIGADIAEGSRRNRERLPAGALLIQPRHSTGSANRRGTPRRGKSRQRHLPCGAREGNPAK